MTHTEKIVDGVVLKYLCQPCPECKAKLEAAEGMAAVLRWYLVHYSNTGGAEYSLAAWEKAGKGEQP